MKIAIPVISWDCFKNSNASRGLIRQAHHKFYGFVLIKRIKNDWLWWLGAREFHTETQRRVENTETRKPELKPQNPALCVSGFLCDSV